MLVLGIETSCDETSLALVRGEGENLEVEKNIVSSQIKIHSKYGGVVPEVAARKHVETIFSILGEFIGDDPRKEIDVVSVASGPGLITSLLVGAEVARTTSYVWEKPLVSVNHIEAHIYANWLNPVSDVKAIKFPALCLVVSGGHTELILIRDFGRYKVIGRTLDDAAGECFDKTAKILGLGYPGGPIISKEAENYRITKPAGRQESRIMNDKFRLPRPMLNTPDFNFSFSGLKTAVLYQVRDLGEKSFTEDIRGEMAFQIEEAITEVLVSKTVKAAKKYKVKTIMLAGGVSANKNLRKKLGETVQAEMPDIKYQIPDTQYCTDNAAMVAAAGYFYAKMDKFTPWQKLKVDPNWSLS